MPIRWVTRLTAFWSWIGAGGGGGGSKKRKKQQPSGGAKRGVGAGAHAAAGGDGAGAATTPPSMLSVKELKTVRHSPLPPPPPPPPPPPHHAWSWWPMRQSLLLAMLPTSCFICLATQLSIFLTARRPVQALKGLGVDCSHCVEKSELVGLLKSSLPENRGKWYERARSWADIERELQRREETERLLRSQV